MLTDAQREALTARLRRGRENLAAAIGRRPAGLAALPLSYGQEQLWFIDKIAPGRGTYNIPYGIRLTGQLDAGALRRALDSLTARHEALRTRLVAGPDGQPVQVIDPASVPPLELADLSGLEPEKRADRLREFIHAEALRPFDLARGPLLCTWLIQLGTDEHMLLAVVHHAVFDGWSTGVFLRELAALYEADAVTGTSPGLAELPVQFADYAVWEREQLAGARREALESWWRETLAGLPVVQFPADRPRPVLEDYDGGLAQHMTGPGLLEALREVSRQAGTTLNVTLMAGLAALLHRYTGQRDLVVGSFSANRGRPELTPLIGFLVNTLPIRADVSGDPPFTELIARVSAATIGAYAHQDLPFGELVRALRLPRDPARAPVFQIALTYAERDVTPVAAAGVEFTGSDLVVGIKAAKFDLDLLAEVRPGGLWLECSYKTSLFEARTVRQFLENFEVLLRAAAADPAAPLSRLPVLTGQQRRQELAGWNDTGCDYPVICVHEAFEAQVARTPAAIAAEYEEEALSYAELNRRANQIARRLRAAGVGPEVLVGVCLPAGLPRLAALLGIWKAGGGYVPLDPALPRERMQYLAADAGLSVVLANADTADRLPRDGAAVLRLDSEWASIGDMDGGNLAGAGTGPARPGNVAYVIYTSGSTGRPKGVVIEHRQAINFLLGQVGYWRIQPSDIVLQFASLNFDGSVMDTFMPLLGGARVVLGPPETLHSPPRLAALINSRRVTIAHMTPAVLGLLSDRQFPTLHTMGTGGEELPSELARRWLRPGLRLVNDYGPTEAAVTATSMDLDASSPLPPAIGLPLSNYQAYVLDEWLNPVPAGVIGELHIGGAGVARGYLNRPALTAQRFIADPLRPGSGGRLYRTGDLVRRRHDGTIVFLGRGDHQVKIRGLRIELGEVETALASHPTVAQAVVTVVPGPAGDKQLAAYLRPASDAVPDPAELRTHCARTLPAYMIPVHLITLATFPLNTSGKIDRAALPAPAGNPTPATPMEAPATRMEAPATPIEAIVAGLFAAVLGLASAGPDDNFFGVGGSSLQVMRLVDRLNTETGVDVGVAAVFLHPTPREIAARIDAIRSGAGQSAASSGPLVELSSGGGGAGGGQPPLVLIHPVGGTVFGYAHLVGELAAGLGVYGMQSPGLATGGITPATLDALVTDYTERIRSAWPDGPYRLGGWSLGGVVAFEIARRLEQAGAHVTLLALLDAPFTIPAHPSPAPNHPNPDLADRSQAELASQFVADAWHGLGRDPAALSDPALPDPALSDPALSDPGLASVERQLGWLAAQLAGGAEDAGELAVALRRRFDVFQAHHRMVDGYQPTGPAVRAPTLIVSADSSLNAPARDRWPRVLAGPVTTVRLDADHYSFLRPPLAAQVAAAILDLAAKDNHD